MENHEINLDDELQHWGIKGQKWGVRRYQNKDGSLTERGKKHYAKEKEALAKEKAKVKAEEKVLANKKKTQAKFDKLEAEKKALADRKKALKDEARGKTAKEADKENSMTLEEARERLLKSTNPKEIYDNRQYLTYQELNDRVNRIDLEARLSNKIPEEQGRLERFNDGMKKTADTINNITNTFKKVDDAYSAVTNSAIGKTLAKQLGLEKDSKAFDYDDFVNNINKKSNQEVADAAKRIINEKNLKKTLEGFKDDAAAAKKVAEEAAKAAEEANAKATFKKMVDDYNVRWQKDGAEDSVKPMDGPNHKDANNSTHQTKFKGIGGPTQKEKTETYSGKVEGEGTSKSSIKEEFESSKKSNSSNPKPDDYYEPIDMSMSNVPAVVSRRGEDYVAGLLEDKDE